MWGVWEVDDECVGDGDVGDGARERRARFGDRSYCVNGFWNVWDFVCEYVCGCFGGDVVWCVFGIIGGEYEVVLRC